MVNPGYARLLAMLDCCRIILAMLDCCRIIVMAELEMATSIQGRDLSRHHESPLGTGDVHFHTIFHQLSSIPSNSLEIPLQVCHL